MGRWGRWSEAMRNYYVATNEDQYGPFRAGPSYPLIFHPDITRTFGPREIPFPASPNAHMGGRIVKTFYHPFENAQQSPGALRHPAGLKMLDKMLAEWGKGVALMENALELTPSRQNAAARQIYSKQHNYRDKPEEMVCSH